MTLTNNTPLKTIIIGAGAITQEWHLPILLGRPDVEVVAVVDRSSKTQTLLSKAYPNLAIYSDVSEIDDAIFEAAIVATPVSFHYQISKSLLEKGKHVLVEKPIALNSVQASELVDIAKQNKLVLGVSLYRRLYPSVKLLKKLIEDKVWGEVKSFTFDWGDLYSWSASSLGNMTKELAGGGVLMDLGPHALDWLCELFGHEVTLLKYADDAVSGIETDCSLSLEFKYQNQSIVGSLALSRIRKLGGDIKVECENADLVLSVGERFSVTVLPKNTQDNNSQVNNSIQYACSDSSQEPEAWFETFAREHDDFINAVKENANQSLSGASVLAAARIIDECYASKSSLQFDWNDTSHITLPDLQGVESIFITGSSGFVGGRLVEVLAERSDIKIFAGINNPNKATRLSRYNINMVQFDLNDLSNIDDVLQQCDAVVHCAIGTTYGDDAAIYKTTVDGTRQLLLAAQRNNVKKFIHMSSLAVIDMNAAVNLIDEQNSISSSDKNIYAVSKLDAENAVIEHASQSDMQLTILRPTTIYGPHSPLFMIGAGSQAISNGIALSNAASSSPSNSVYIDNLIACILARLCSDDTSLQTYFVNDDDSFTYEDFYSFFTGKFEQPFSPNSSVSNQGNSDSPSAIKEIFEEIKQIISSKELRKLALKLYNSKKLGFPARWIIDKVPAIESRLRDESGPVYLKNQKHNALETIEASTSALVSMKKFKEDHPDYKPLGREHALEMTESWIRFCFNK